MRGSSCAQHGMVENKINADVSTEAPPLRYI